MGRSLIEVAFPLKEVSQEALREKNIRHGHPSTLHIWWARRPLAAMRAAIYAALVDEGKDDEETMKFIARLSKWENSLNQMINAKARKDILSSNGGEPPKVLDCFAGGGSIPLEALRLGCETYALEYNPVAVLILKATVEFPMRFGQKLLDEVKRWGNWVLEEARKELERFYPKDDDGSIPVGYLWARTIPCQNPNCKAEIPLMRQFWLARKSNRQIALFPIPDKVGKCVEFAIVRRDGGEWKVAEAPAGLKCHVPADFDPSKGTVRRARANCLVCNTTVPDKKVRELFREGKSSQRMVAVVLHHPERKGKEYRLPKPSDLNAYKEAEKALEDKVARLRDEWGIEPVPDEPTPLGGGPGAERAFSVHKYGLTRWGDLFNSRQKLALITFAEKVREAYGRVLKDCGDEEFAKAVVTYLALGLDMQAAFCNGLARWENTSEAIKQLFSRQALPMLWDYAEVCPFSTATGSWEAGSEYYSAVLSHCTQVNSHPAQVQQSSSTSLPYPDKFFDAVITDPPYYDNVPYSDLSDFFYVWLKRTIGDLYPELFMTMLTPKDEELVADTVRRGGTMEAAKRWFEEMLTQAFREIARVLKDEGIAVIVFAHKSVEAWDAIINALLKAGLMMTASWPVKMEMEVRLRGQASAALLSSVLMVCRKRVAKEVGDYPQVHKELRERISERLERFWKDGLRGADFFMSAIGPAVEVFGRYERVEKPSGEPMTVYELLSEVRRIVAEDALKRILHNPDLSGIDPASRFYILWRWTFNGMKALEQGNLEDEEEDEDEGNGKKQKSRVPKVAYDEARLIAQAIVGAEGIEKRDWEQWKFIKIEKGSKGATVQVLPADERRDDEFRGRAFDTMVDALHYALRLWAARRYDELKKHLEATYGSLDAFWRYAQALADILPEGDKERQWLHGLLVWQSGKIGTAREGSQPTFDFGE